jgi:nucleotide-binding universal stress UspA family protein
MDSKCALHLAVRRTWLEMIMFKKLLVPLDGSELAERALDPALAAARQGDGEVVLLGVPVYKHVAAPGPTGYGVVVPDQAIDLGREETEAYLSQLRQARNGRGLRLRIRVVDGDVAGSIVDTAAEEGADLIVMTTHGYSGFSRWMLGSVTERVLRGAPCPVLVIRHARPLANAVITLDGSVMAEQAIKPGLELAQFFNDGFETQLLVCGQIDARQSEAPQGMIYETPGTVFSVS